jgi:hypothetical protein
MIKNKNKNYSLLDELLKLSKEKLYNLQTTFYHA